MNDTDMLREQVREAMGAGIRANDVPGYLKALDTIMQLFEAELERIGLEVIGEDPATPSPLGDFWNVGRSQLRAEQRARLTQALKGREGEFHESNTSEKR